VAAAIPELAAGFRRVRPGGFGPVALTASGPEVGYPCREQQELALPRPPCDVLREGVRRVRKYLQLPT
jgi:hypothetical protein